jgi:hypothetical protein
MLYSLANGRVINIDLDSYLSMSDAALNELAHSNEGDSIINPFYGSSLRKQPRVIDLEEDDVSTITLDKIDPETKMELVKDDFYTEPG